MPPLLKKKCKPCEDSDISPMSHEDAEKLMEQLSGWLLSTDAKKITKTLLFSDFMDSLTFVNSVASLAELEGHHPDIWISYNKVTLQLTTYSIQGLTENDFILATKIDEMLKKQNIFMYN